MNEQKSKSSLLNNKIFITVLTAVIIGLCGYLPIGLLSILYDPSRPEYTSPTPETLQNYFTFQRILLWLGFLILPIIILSLLVIAYRKSNTDDNTLKDESWTILLITLGIMNAYYWGMLLLYGNMGDYIHETAGENSLMTFFIGCPSPMCIFPLFALQLAVRPRKKSLWWWLGLILMFSGVILFIVSFLSLLIF